MTCYDALSALPPFPWTREPKKFPPKPTAARHSPVTTLCSQIRPGCRNPIRSELRYNLLFQFNLHDCERQIT